MLILAIINQCDASEATNALLLLIKGAISHSSTRVQVKIIVPKPKHWVDKLRQLENWKISHWVNPFSLELQPENFKKNIRTPPDNKSGNQYRDLGSGGSNGDKDPFFTRIRFLHCNGVYGCPELVCWLLSKGCSSSKRKKKKKGVSNQTPPCTFDASVISMKWLIKPGKRYRTWRT